MSTSRLSTLSLKNGLPKSNNIWDGTTGFFESIATITVTSNQSNVKFENIPSTYAHLQIRGLSRSNYPTGNYVSTSIRLNSDAGNNYSAHYLIGNGSSASAYAWTSTNSVFGSFNTTANALSNNFSSYVIDILDYANTNKYKTVRVLNGFDNNGTGSSSFNQGIVGLSSGLWMSTNAVNSITIFTDASYNWVTNTTFALYGIRSF